MPPLPANLSEVFDAPETAALAALETIALQARNVLIYAHPDIAGRATDTELRYPDPAYWIADTLIGQLDAISMSVARYRRAIRLRRSWATVPTSDPDDTPS